MLLNYNETKLKIIEKRKKLTSNEEISNE